MVAQLRKRIILSVVIGIVVVALLGLVSDLSQVGASLSNFAWHTVPVILGFTVLNYVLRWLKWDLYLRHLNLGATVSRGDSALMFTAGMVMAVTPGKIGEVLKSYLLRRINQTPISISAPIVVAERMTDGIAMLLLMGVGLTLYPPAAPLFWALVGATVLGIVLIQSTKTVNWMLSLVAHTRFAQPLQNAYQSSRTLLGWGLLSSITLISVVSWFFECIAFMYVLEGLGITPSLVVLQQSTFIFAASTLFGLVSLLPGGLGVSEASSTGLLVWMIPMSTAAAAAATMLIRFGTLWFGVLLGVVALAWFNRRYPLSNEGEDA
ncbi:MAG: flippase-like domain-containing protein [Chloroflexi bacterium]|nr:flippase-like domain-containing protein [Chloroflexota bacterium]